MASSREQIATTALTATRFRDLLEIARANRPNDDLDIVRRAYAISLQHHSGQLRASGEPYLVHPLEVAILLAEMKLDTTAIAAGLQHDSIEDTTLTIEELKQQFYADLCRELEASCGIAPSDVMISVVTNSEADWSFGNGHAQFLTGEL